MCTSVEFLAGFKKDANSNKENTFLYTLLAKKGCTESSSVNVEGIIDDTNLDRYCKSEPSETDVDSRSTDSLIPSDVTDVTIIPKRIKFPCLYIRIGLCEGFPINDDPHIPVFLNDKGFFFTISTKLHATFCSSRAHVVLKNKEIHRIDCHFDNHWAQYMFIHITPKMSKELTAQCENFTLDGFGHWDTNLKIITFLLDEFSSVEITELLWYLKYLFPREGVVNDKITWEEAEKILSNPNSRSPQPKVNKPCGSPSTLVKPVAYEILKKMAEGNTSNKQQTSKPSLSILVPNYITEGPVCFENQFSRAPAVAVKNERTRVERFILPKIDEQSKSSSTSVKPSVQKTNIQTRGRLPEFECKSVTVGSYKIFDITLQVTSESFSFTSLKDQSDPIILNYSDITNLVFYFGKFKTYLFVRTNTDYAKKIGVYFKTMAPTIPYYNSSPTELEMQHRMVIYLGNLRKEQMAFFKKTFYNCKFPSKEIKDLVSAKFVLKKFLERPLGKELQAMLKNGSSWGWSSSNISNTGAASQHAGITSISNSNLYEEGCSSKNTSNVFNTKHNNEIHMTDSSCFAKNPNGYSSSLGIQLESDSTRSDSCDSTKDDSSDSMAIAKSKAEDKNILLNCNHNDLINGGSRKEDGHHVSIKQEKDADMFILGKLEDNICLVDDKNLRRVEVKEADMPSFEKSYDIDIKPDVNTLNIGVESNILEYSTNATINEIAGSSFKTTANEMKGALEEIKHIVKNEIEKAVDSDMFSVEDKMQFGKGNMNTTMQSSCFIPVFYTPSENVAFNNGGKPLAVKEMCNNNNIVIKMEKETKSFYTQKSFPREGPGIPNNISDIVVKMEREPLSSCGAGESFHEGGASIGNIVVKMEREPLSSFNTELRFCRKELSIDNIVGGIVKKESELLFNLEVEKRLHTTLTNINNNIHDIVKTESEPLSSFDGKESFYAEELGVGDNVIVKIESEPLSSCDAKESFYAEELGISDNVIVKTESEPLSSFDFKESFYAEELGIGDNVIAKTESEPLSSFDAKESFYAEELGIGDNVIVKTESEPLSSFDGKETSYAEELGDNVIVKTESEPLSSFDGKETSYAEELGDNVIVKTENEPLPSFDAKESFYADELGIGDNVIVETESELSNFDAKESFYAEELVIGDNVIIKTESEPLSNFNSKEELGIGGNVIVKTQGEPLSSSDAKESFYAEELGIGDNVVKTESEPLSSSITEESFYVEKLGIGGNVSVKAESEPLSICGVRGSFYRENSSISNIVVKKEYGLLSSFNTEEGFCEKTLSNDNNIGESIIKIESEPSSSFDAKESLCEEGPSIISSGGDVAKIGGELLSVIDAKQSLHTLPSINNNIDGNVKMESEPLSHFNSEGSLPEKGPNTLSWLRKRHFKLESIKDELNIISSSSHIKLCEKVDYNLEHHSDDSSDSAEFQPTLLDAQQVKNIRPNEDLASQEIYSDSLSSICENFNSSEPPSFMKTEETQKGKPLSNDHLHSENSHTIKNDHGTNAAVLSKGRVPNQLNHTCQNEIIHTQPHMIQHWLDNSFSLKELEASDFSSELRKRLKTSHEKTDSVISNFRISHYNQSADNSSSHSSSDSVVQSSTFPEIETSTHEIIENNPSRPSLKRERSDDDDWEAPNERNLSFQCSSSNIQCR